MLLTWIWVTISFNYYLIGLFLKYLPGDIFANTLASSISELLAVSMSGLLLQWFDIKHAMSCLFIISAASGVWLIHAGNTSEYTAVIIMACKFGIAATFNCVYIATAAMFKPNVSATAFGLCNFFARFATVMAPFVAEMDEPLPIALLTITCFTASLAVIGLTEEPES